MNTTVSPVHPLPPAGAGDQDVVTVTLPAPDARLPLADRLSLRLALWLLLRAQRPKPSAARDAAGARRSSASDPLRGLSRENAHTLNSYGLLRQLR